MSNAVPVCPDCTYPLTGLTDPRCPECGLTFDRRLLTDPTLARPRPAWERRPHVSCITALWSTFADVSFRPKLFFNSIQQPDHLRRSLSWIGMMLSVMYGCATAYILTTHYFFSRPPSARLARADYYAYVLSRAGTALVEGIALVGLPVVTLLLVTDVILWRDRSRYRVLLKTSVYGIGVFIWAALGICTTALTLRVLRAVPLIPPPEFQESKPWTNWILAGAMTWYFFHLLRAVADRRFAALLPTTSTRRGTICTLVTSTWAGALYLVLVDSYIGLRFATASWAWILECGLV